MPGPGKVVLTALMLAGRVGPGTAAELGSMVVPDQVNALRALGSDPIRKLVVPRVLAGTLMAPVLTIIADVVGILGGWVIAVFQPHRFSRTAALGPELGAALVDADVVIVTDVYSAGEQPVAGVTGELVAGAAVAAGVDTHYVPSVADVPARLIDLVEAGDLVLTLGAGDITEVGPVVLQRLRGGRG